MLGRGEINITHPKPGFIFIKSELDDEGEVAFVVLKVVCRVNILKLQGGGGMKRFAFGSIKLYTLAC